MEIKSLNKKIKWYLKEHQLESKFEKAKNLFEKDIHYPSLKVEVLEPKHLKIYSFRLDKKYRAIFIITDNLVEIISITKHYK